MNMPYKLFEQHVIEMKNLGEILTPFNFPKVSIKDENDINILKTREVTIDGYDIILHYNKSDCEGHFVSTLQILGKHIPFLPFSLVCKIAIKFLGNNNLSLIETFQDNRRVFCWTLVSTKEGKPIEGPYNESENEHRVYEGFEYRRMNSHNVNFY